MPTFSHELPEQSTHSGFRLVRTPTAHALVAHVLSDRLVGCNTHFLNNRTIPCEPPTCDACASGVPWRWHGYLAILLEATQEIVIFECTAKSAAAFSAYHERHGTTRGAHMKAQRLNARPNGRVLIQCRPADLAKVHLPTSPHVEKVLCHIWTIPENQVTTAAQMKRPPAAAVEIDRSRPEIDAHKSRVTEALLKAAARPGTNPPGNGRTDRAH